MASLFRDFAVDLRFAFRSAVHAPLGFLIAALSIGIGVGANVLVYTWLDNLVLRPLPAVPEPGRLVAFNWAARTGATGGVPPFSYPAFQEWRVAARSFEAMAAEGILRLSIGRANIAGAEPAWGVLTTANYFEVVGVRAMLGRTFRPEEERVTAPVAVLSERFWRRTFGADSAAIGRSLTANGAVLTVVGVAAPRFGGVTAGLGFDLWVPLSMQPYLSANGSALQDRSQRWLRGVGRLKPGVSVAQADRELAGIAQGASAAAGEKPVTGASVQRFRDQQLGSLLLPLLGGLLVVTGLVLLLACANVANLLLVRASGRRREMGIRLALGAGRGRLIRQLLVESLLLAAGGGLVALALTAATKGAFGVFVPPVPEPVSYSLDLNVRILGVAVAISLFTVFLFGLAPALASSRPELVDALRAGVGGGRRGKRIRGVLAVSQMAFSVAALFAAGLFLQSLAQARRTDLGIGDPTRLLLVGTDFGMLRRTAAEADPILERALAELRRLPGVEAASAATSVPLGFGGHAFAPMSVDGYTFATDESAEVERVSVAPGYFSAMGVTVVEGRPIDDTDRADGGGVAVVNQAFARRFLPGRDPLGRRIRHGPLSATIVGVAQDGRYDTPGSPPTPLVYTPWRQWYRPGLTLLVRTRDDPRPMLAAVREAVRHAHADLPFLDPRTMAEHMQASTFVQRLGGSVLGVLGLAALLMACVGLYAVIASGVAERTQEIGIRLALGERADRIQRQVLTRSARLGVLGWMLGAGAALGLGQLFRDQLIGVSPANPVLLGSIGIALLLAAAAASWFPARRAARQDPLMALRTD